MRGGKRDGAGRRFGVRDPINRALDEACARHTGDVEEQLHAIVSDRAEPRPVRLEALRRACAVLGLQIVNEADG